MAIADLPSIKNSTASQDLRGQITKDTGIFGKYSGKNISKSPASQYDNFFSYLTALKNQISNGNSLFGSLSGLFRGALGTGGNTPFDELDKQLEDALDDRIKGSNKEQKFQMEQMMRQMLSFEAKLAREWYDDKGGAFNSNDSIKRGDEYKKWLNEQRVKSGSFKFSDFKDNNWVLQHLQMKELKEKNIRTYVEHITNDKDSIESLTYGPNGKYTNGYYRTIISNNYSYDSRSLEYQDHLFDIVDKENNSYDNFFNRTI